MALIKERGSGAPPVRSVGTAAIHVILRAGRDGYGTAAILAIP